MKHVVDIPDEIEQTLKQRALVSGGDVDRMIELAIVSYARTEFPSFPSGRYPDPLPDVVQIAPTCDLPRTSPQFIAIQMRASRHMDPIVEPA